MTYLAPFVRIALRILGGYMIGRGWADEGDLWLFTDPDLVGAVLLVLNEVWYFLARRYGWAK